MRNSPDGTNTCVMPSTSETREPSGVTGIVSPRLNDAISARVRRTCLWSRSETGEGIL